MKDIKFRAYNTLVKQFIYFENPTGIADAGYTGLLFKSEKMYMGEFADIEQFTGVQDCEGNDIYEGDLVQFNWNDGLQDKETIAEIKYSDDQAAFIADDKKRLDFSINYNHMQKKIIGNVHLPITTKERLN